MATTPRPLEIAVLSDLHLGTYGCHAEEVLRYLYSIRPKLLVLNGDIVDIWQFSKRYWPSTHMRVVQRIVEMLSEGTEVVYLPGNHDELLRRFLGLRIGNFHIQNKLLLELPCGQKAWFFHGDVFDVTMQHAKWLARLGAVGYDLLILINSLTNNLLEKFGQPKISLSQRIKQRVKLAVSYIGDFERTASDIAIENHYGYVICGHIHHAEMRTIRNQQGQTTYLNSGDWVESLTALEYQQNHWSLYQYRQDALAQGLRPEATSPLPSIDALLQEFGLSPSLQTY